MTLAQRFLESDAGRRLFRSAAFLRMLSSLADSALGRPALAAIETRVLAGMLQRQAPPGPEGRALGSLFARYEPGRAARAIYRDVFSPERFERGYQSQVGQDLFLNRWMFKDGGPGFFVDVGAYDGELGSNTWFLEKRLGWTGVAFEPNPPAFAALVLNRSCQAIQACAYDRDGEVRFLALSEKDQRPRQRLRRPPNLAALALDPRHGALMLSGIQDHLAGPDRIERVRELQDLDQAVLTVPCRRIDSVLDERGVRTVDYLSVDVEGAERQVLEGMDFARIRVNVVGVETSPSFPEVYRLLTTAGFEYQGLLFFDEIFVHRERRFTWER